MWFGSCEVSRHCARHRAVPEFVVRLPLGAVNVLLERRGLRLEDRGGFEACWLPEQPGQAPEADAVLAALDTEAFRLQVKDYLRELYRQAEGRDPSPITLNLASHQLLEDVIGWSKLNTQLRPREDAN